MTKYGGSSGLSIHRIPSEGWCTRRYAGIREQTAWLCAQDPVWVTSHSLLGFWWFCSKTEHANNHFFFISYGAELIEANQVLCFGNWLLTIVIGPLPALDHGLDVPAVDNPRKYSRIMQKGLGFGSAIISIRLVWLFGKEKLVVLVLCVPWWDETALEATKV